MTRTTAVVLALAFLAACGGGNPETPQNQLPTVTLASITPPGGTILTAGQKLTVTASVNCTVPYANAELTMVIRTDKSRPLNSGSETSTKPLVKGMWIVTLTDTITVPPTGNMVQIYLLLVAAGTTPSTIGAQPTVQYGVQ